MQPTACLSTIVPYNVLKAAGLDLDQAGPLVKMVIEFIKGKVGGDVVNTVLEKVPQLKQLIGS